MKYGKRMFGDCLTLMSQIESGSIDAIITDPPYRVISDGNQKGLSYKHKGSITEKNDGKIFQHNDISCRDYFPEFFRVLKDNAHLYIMVNVLNLTERLTEAQKYFALHNLLVWEKQNAGPNRWYMKNAEYVLFLRKGKAFPINNMGSKTVHQFYNNVGNKLHPTEKPIELMQLYIENSSVEGEVILDPFAGSFPVAIACINTNRKYICIEKDENYFNIGSERIRKHIEQLNSEVKQGK